MTEATIRKPKKRRSRASLGDRVFETVNYILMILLIIVTLYPMLNTLAVSLNDATDSLRGGIYLWPRKWTFENYKFVFQEADIIHAAWISVLRTVIGTVLTVFCSAMIAYTISRPEYVLRKFITIAFVLTMYFNGGLIPTYLLMRDLGLIGTFWVYIWPGLIGVFNLIVIRSFIENLPDNILESAKIDGAGDFRTFFHIVLPLCTPVLATVSLFTGVWQWNSWFDVFLYNSSKPNLSTLQYELQKVLQFSNASIQKVDFQAAAAQGGIKRVTPYAVRGTMMIVVSVPIIIVYPFLQKYFVKGMLVGSIKE
jgi:putative aldouronate transport system permease protein